MPPLPGPPSPRSSTKERLQRWCRRNGIVLRPPGWPGLIHQAWGWYDGLSGVAAAGVVLSITLFIVATAAYFLGATALVSAARDAGSEPVAIATASTTPHPQVPPHEPGPPRTELIAPDTANPARLTPEPPSTEPPLLVPPTPAQIDVTRQPATATALRAAPPALNTTSASVIPADVAPASATNASPTRPARTPTPDLPFIAGSDAATALPSASPVRNAAPSSGRNLSTLVPSPATPSPLALTPGLGRPPAPSAATAAVRGTVAPVASVGNPTALRP